ncbi:MAG: hypothetical protein K2P81_09545 [Bacteriovoracaceae bacterium]|nr:hypothetical protein [Bacteriovoracaceae bacterium]
MKIITALLASLFLSSCATIHFRSNQVVPVTFTGNPQHQKEVVIEGKRDFFWWGNDPDHAVVFVDEEVRNAGYPALSKAIIYEQKSPSDILISFLTFGIYMPRAWTIMGYTEANPALVQPKQN